MNYQSGEEYARLHGLNNESIKKFNLSWKENEFYIPLDNGRIKTRYLDYDKKNPNSKKYKNPTGEATLFNSSILNSNPEYVVIACGEMDCIRLDQKGINAVSSTAGELSSFKKGWVEALEEIKDIFYCPDNDKTGQKAIEKICKNFPKIKIIHLPLDVKDICEFFQRYSKDDFRTIIDEAEEYIPESKDYEDIVVPVSYEKQELLKEPISYKIVEEKVKQLLPNSQIALKLVLAIAVSCNFPNQVMLWLLLVGVPSSGKTDAVRLTKDAEFTFYLDSLTQNAFISGERANKKNKVYDLLPLLDKKVLVIKDWTAIFSLDEKMTKKLLGDLVGIYDKEFTKFSSRRGNIGYASAFSQLGCITPATLNRHTNYLNMVGPRFLCYIMPEGSDEDNNNSFELIFSDQDRSAIEKEARLYVSSYLTQLSQKEPDLKPLSTEVQLYLRTASEFMSCCRGIIILQPISFQNKDGEEVKYYDVGDVQIEQPWRAIQQLISLAKYLAFVVGKDEVGAEELAIIKEIVLSSMPADRSQALRVVKNKAGIITAKVLADSSDRSPKTSRRLLQELEGLKVLDKIKGSGTLATDYVVNTQFKDFLLLDPTEFMSHKDTRGTETPHGIDQNSSKPAPLINSIPGLEEYGKN